jgi:hypothetical protein
MGRMRSLFAVLVALFLFVVGGAGIAGAAKLVVDKSHGQTADVSGLTNVLLSRGWVVSELREPVTADALSDCSLFIVTPPAMDFTPDEVAVVRSYVENGGGLWMLSEPYGPGPFDAVAQPFGVGFNLDMVLKDVGGFWNTCFDVDIPAALSSHPLFQGITSFVYDEGASLATSDGSPLTADSWAGLLLNVSDSYSDTWMYYPETPILAASEVGAGRALFIGDATPLEPTAYANLGDGNKLLLDNIVAWLEKPDPVPPDPAPDPDPAPSPDPPGSGGPISVTINIRPGSSGNEINLNSQGIVRVAILNTPDFDVKQVDRKTVLFAEAQPVYSRFVDANGDGQRELLFVFPTRALKLTAESTEGVLTGMTLDGKSFEGKDAVRMVPKPKAGDALWRGKKCAGKKGK